MRCAACNVFSSQHTAICRKQGPRRGSIKLAIFIVENNASTGQNASTLTSLIRAASGGLSANYWVVVGRHLQTSTPRTSFVISMIKLPGFVLLPPAQNHRHLVTVLPVVHSTSSLWPLQLRSLSSCTHYPTSNASVIRYLLGYQRLTLPFCLRSSDIFSTLASNMAPYRLASSPAILRRC